MASPLTLSVVIPNYNYAKYVGIAVQSALDIRWPSVEVIVVDDGSTDNSMEVLATFADKIIVVSQANAGQMQSCVNGFRRSTGSVVIFLDSDDALHPDIMQAIAEAWSDEASKFQFQMRAINAAGIPTGSVQPQFFVIPTPQQIREWAITAGVYPSPPGSGNAYPRRVVEKVFNFDSAFSDRAPDSYLVTAAPAFGDVITIPRPLVDYRVHGENHGAFLRLDESRFAREVDVTRRRFDFFIEIARSVGLAIDPGALRRNMLYLCLRAASYALRPSTHPIQGDSSFRIIGDSFRALGYSQGFSYAQRMSLFIWTVCVLCGPRYFSRSVVSWRYAPTSRPKIMKAALNLLRVVR